MIKLTYFAIGSAENESLHTEETYRHQNKMMMKATAVIKIIQILCAHSACKRFYKSDAEIRCSMIDIASDLCMYVKPTIRKEIAG
jgi:hypothetical protein